uniref:Histidine--tRNA ligase, chloroplastic n=1 Tax=Hommersandiophycus borowitzkae TaxID=268573 RepID=A0A1G4NUS3_9FLOR|nr:Histidine-tRNA ligase [Hommersandiophycus borowitzkae]SCW22259.1 Histidine-tRNA ligase [Hommersandiophycus borowitzkae]
MQSVRGMQDILPEESKYWQYIHQIALNILESANYQEIKTPIVEARSLFERSIGEETDIISKEMYTFNDRAKRALTLRPEGTASIARAILQHNLCANNRTQKLWYFGPMFRYERPQQGRQRQFHQLGIECYGSNHPALDAEIIYIAWSILSKLQCGQVVLHLNSIGNSKERQMYSEQLKQYFLKYIKNLDLRLVQTIHKNPLRLLDSKESKLHEIISGAPNILQYLDNNSTQHFDLVQQYLTDLNVPFQVNNKLVRGLDYYNNTVFEFKTNALGTQDTICGGGRYDSLTQQIGGNPIHAIGWGMGIERLIILLKNHIDIINKPPCIYIATQNTNYIGYSLRILPVIQQYNLKYEIDLSGSSLTKQLQKANKQNAMICIIIGEEEITNHTLTIKWLEEGDQKTYSTASFEQLVPVIASRYKDKFTQNIYKAYSTCL